MGHSGEWIWSTRSIGSIYPFFESLGLGHLDDSCQLGHFGHHESLGSCEINCVSNSGYLGHKDKSSFEFSDLKGQLGSWLHWVILGQKIKPVNVVIFWIDPTGSFGSIGQKLTRNSRNCPCLYPYYESEFQFDQSCMKRRPLYHSSLWSGLWYPHNCKYCIHLLGWIMNGSRPSADTRLNHKGDWPTHSQDIRSSNFFLKSWT